MGQVCYLPGQLCANDCCIASFSCLALVMFSIIVVRLARCTYLLMNTCTFFYKHIACRGNSKNILLAGSSTVQLLTTQCKFHVGILRCIWTPRKSAPFDMFATIQTVALFINGNIFLHVLQTVWSFYGTINILWLSILHFLILRSSFSFSCQHGLRTAKCKSSFVCWHKFPWFLLIRKHLLWYFVRSVLHACS